MNQMLLLESSEQTADGLSRGANYLRNFFMSKGQLDVTGIFGFRILIEPSRKQASQFLTG